MTATPGPAPSTDTKDDDTRTAGRGGIAVLGAKVFFLWGSLCVLCLIYAYVLIPETKGLSLEQVDRMMEECGERLFLCRV